MITGLLIVSAIYVFPIYVYIAVLRKQPASAERYNYLYGGLTFETLASSTVGGGFSVGFFFTAILGAGSLYGSVPLWTLLFLVSILFPYTIQKIALSKTVSAYFADQSYSNLAKPADLRFSFIEFVCSNYGRFNRSIIYTLFILLLGFSMIMEISYTPHSPSSRLISLS
jgi:hypothetical protein